MNNLSTDYFTKRKSCRNFNPQKISKKEIETIVMKATKAPTCGDMQLYSVIVTQDSEKLTLLSSYHYNQSAAVTAPMILTICADFFKFSKWCEINGADNAFNNFHSFIMAMTDAIILAQQIITVAEMEGLATCYLGTVNYNAKEISEMLGLPYLVVPVASVAIGYPAHEGEETQRQPVESILQFEEYKDFSDEEINRIFEHLENDPNKNQFIRENGKKNMAQVFSEVRYPRDMNEKVSKNFLELIRRKGYGDRTEI